MAIFDISSWHGVSFIIQPQARKKSITEVLTSLFIVGTRYQETHIRCAPSIVAIEHRSDKCGKKIHSVHADPISDSLAILR